MPGVPPMTLESSMSFKTMELALIDPEPASWLPWWVKAPSVVNMPEISWNKKIALILDVLDFFFDLGCKLPPIFNNVSEIEPYPHCFWVDLGGLQPW